MPDKMKRLSDDELDQVTGGGLMTEEEYNAHLATFNRTYTCQKCGCQYIRLKPQENIFYRNYHVHYCDTCIAPLKG